MHRYPVLLTVLCYPALTTPQIVTNFVRSPKFYQTPNCTGGIDPGPMKLGVAGGAVLPLEQVFMPDWCLGRCMAAPEGYSAMIVADGSECTGGHAERLFKLQYYDSNTECNGVPEVTPMVPNQCVGYQGGSVIMVTNVPAPDLCVAMRYLKDAAAGGLVISEWDALACKGTPSRVSSDSSFEALVRCSSRPWVCKGIDGCCRDWDDVTCTPGDYVRKQLACTRDTPTSPWQIAIRTPHYADDWCIQPIGPAPTMGIGVCTPTGPSTSQMVTLAPPLNIDTLCEAVDMSLRNKLDNAVAWGSINAAPAACVYTPAALLSAAFAVIIALQ
eukprot:TRINITY_DN26557_c0_g1_i1.p1 TRINITY_DN26557_c0_g1~~TRINITY_DN26557_c0_g1_i1.p1  ORF type:complete len:328 (+),score=35.76 TRINITY_DN26557_c0_g1_i1:1-984(+)